MIVLDSSALVAMLKPEADGATLTELVSGRVDAFVPAACYLETTMVLSAIPGARVRLDALFDEYGIVILPCDERQARLAADAFERFGRGSGHPARLNFGDCLAYAAAAIHRAPLLFKGEDFARTDVARPG